MSPVLVIAPILVPLFAAALQLLAGERRPRLVAALGLASCVALLAIAVALLLSPAIHTGQSTTLSYRVGDWPAPFAIVLVADRLSVLMLTLAAVLALAALPAAMARRAHHGQSFQPLFQFLLAGLDGAFLTGDLFNLFVFFEVLLAASYGLVLHGPGKFRVGAGLHYIAVNLAASLLFLLGVSLIFGVAGTLNMAALAALVPQLSAHATSLFHVGAALLGLAFLIKSAMWPLGFWLPRTYAATTPAAAAMFALMTKVGIYVLLRLSVLLFGADAGSSRGFGADWLLWGGMATVAAGIIGMLGARDLGRLAGYNVIISSGTLLGAIGLDQPAVTAGALAYLAISALAIAAFFLVAGVLDPPGDEDGGAVMTLEPYEADAGRGDDPFADEDERRSVIPAPVSFLAAGFFACAILLSGLPPLSGFLAKFALLAPMLDAPARAPALTLFALLLLASFCTVVAMCRAGIGIFWGEERRALPQAHLAELGAIAALVLVCVLLTAVPGKPFEYLVATAQQLHTPASYVHGVLGGGGTAP